MRSLQMVDIINIIPHFSIGMSKIPNYYEPTEEWAEDHYGV